MNIHPNHGVALFARLQRGGHSRPALPAGARAILSPRALLAASHRQACLRQLASLVSVTDGHFRALYRGAAENLAGLVQQLPASEAHHHASEGGLLDHSLEVAVAALQLRRGYLLPPGAVPEDQAWLQDLWTYAAFTVGLLHDSGKPVVDQRVYLLTSAANRQGCGTLGSGRCRKPAATG